MNRPHDDQDLAAATIVAQLNQWRFRAVPVRRHRHGPQPRSEACGVDEAGNVGSVRDVALSRAETYPSCGWLSLPSSLCVQQVFSFLDERDHCLLGASCKRLRDLSLLGHSWWSLVLGSGQAPRCDRKFRRSRMCAQKRAMGACGFCLSLQRFFDGLVDHARPVELTIHWRLAEDYVRLPKLDRVRTLCLQVLPPSLVPLIASMTRLSTLTIQLAFTGMMQPTCCGGWEDTDRCMFALGSAPRDAPSADGPRMTVVQQLIASLTSTPVRALHLLTLPFSEAHVSLLVSRLPQLEELSLAVFDAAAVRHLSSLAALRSLCLHLVAYTNSRRTLPLDSFSAMRSLRTLTVAHWDLAPAALEAALGAHNGPVVLASLTSVAGFPLATLLRSDLLQMPALTAIDLPYGTRLHEIERLHSFPRLTRLRFAPRYGNDDSGAHRWVPRLPVLPHLAELSAAVGTPADCAVLAQLLPCLTTDLHVAVDRQDGNFAALGDRVLQLLAQNSPAGPVRIASIFHQNGPGFTEDALARLAPYARRPFSIELGEWHAVSRRFLFRTFGRLRIELIHENCEHSTLTLDLTGYECPVYARRTFAEEAGRV